MIIYLSGVFESFGSCLTKEQRKEKRDVWDYYDLSELSILQSYAYHSDKCAEHYKDCKNFLCDSGAFTLMMSKTKSNNFDIKKFAKEYGTFIRKYDIKNFIELDVDGIYDIQTYIDCLHILQDTSGKDPIRVFHGWRGKDYFLELVKAKDYICMGGISSGVNRNNALGHFQWFLDKAHESNCKVHGLAVTASDIIRKYNFDSVDSSSWTYGARGAQLYRFDGTGFQTYNGSEHCPPGKRVHTNWILRYNLDEWIKFQHMGEQIISLYDKSLN